jgi:hypothetical protein
MTTISYFRHILYVRVTRGFYPPLDQMPPLHAHLQCVVNDAHIIFKFPRMLQNPGLFNEIGVGKSAFSSNMLTRTERKTPLD